MCSALTRSTWMHCKPEAALLGFLALFLHVSVPHTRAPKTRAPRALTALMLPPAPTGWEVLW